MANPKLTLVRQQPETSIIALSWLEPDKPPHDSFSKIEDPFLFLRVMAVPEEGDPLSFELPCPEPATPVIIPVPTTTAHAYVLSVDHTTPIENEAAYLVTIKRHARFGMNWRELGFCIGAEMVGFNQFVGRVEGRLAGLLPCAELAMLNVPSLTEFYSQELEKALKQDPNQEVDENELRHFLEDGPAVWIPWSTLRMKQTGLANLL
jgi:hypothetical protein